MERCPICDGLMVLKTEDQIVTFEDRVGKVEDCTFHQCIECKESFNTKDTDLRTERLQAYLIKQALYERDATIEKLKAELNKK